jgi:hypothetical protein
MHDVYIESVDIRWEGPDAALAALRKALEAGTGKGAALARSYAGKIQGEIDLEGPKLAAEGIETEEWPWFYFRQLQGDFPETTIIFDLTFRGVAGGCDGGGRFFTVSRAGERLYNASSWLEQPAYADTWGQKNWGLIKSGFIKERGGAAWLKERGIEEEYPSWYRLLDACLFTDGLEQTWYDFREAFEKAKGNLRSCSYDHYRKQAERGRLPALYAKQPFGGDWDLPEAGIFSGMFWSEMDRSGEDPFPHYVETVREWGPWALEQVPEELRARVKQAV